MAIVFASRHEVAAYQLDTIQQLMASLKSNRFYARKLSGISQSFSDLDEFSARIPFTTKQELVADQQGEPPFGTNLSFPLKNYTRFHQTSGTTGAPLRWLDTPESWESMVVSWAEVYFAANVCAGDRIYFAFSFGPFLGFWLAFDAAQKIGALCIPGGSLSSEGRLNAIIQNRATVLCCTPTYALRLAEVAAHEQIDLATARIKKIIVAGEPGGSIPAIREKLEKQWPGTKIFDHHGMTEVGPVTYQCPSQPGILHVIESAYFPEIINPATSTKAALDETGELVLTTLTRLGSPLLRYRTGDLVLAVAPKSCVCGTQNLALRGGILGRVDDMLIIRGVNIYPSAVDAVLGKFREILEYQILVQNRSHLAELFLRVELDANCEDVQNLVQRIEAKMQTTFGLRVTIDVVEANSLPRFEMKSERWIR